MKKPHKHKSETNSNETNENLNESAKSAKFANNNTSLNHSENKKIQDFADFADSNHNLEHLSGKKKSDDVLFNTPIIPQHVYETLPEFLKECVAPIDGKRDKDVFLTSSIGLLSGIFKNLKGQYQNKWIHSNLFVFVIAPAGSGKGMLDFVYKLGEYHHKSLLKENSEQIQDYKDKLRQLEKATNIDEFPEKPPFKILYIPANCSSSKIQAHLTENDGRGIIFETEADTLGNMFAKDWAIPGEIFRKTFHHEPISNSRSTNDTYIQNSDSFMSIVLSGTPNQVHKIIPNAEDGLFSRFIFTCLRVTQNGNQENQIPTSLT